MVGGVVIGDLVDDLGIRLERAVAVGEPLRDPELQPVLGAEGDGSVAAVGRRTDADVHDHVEDGATRNPDELVLGLGGHLVMQAAHDALGPRAGVVVLDEHGVEAGVPQRALIVGLGKEAARIAMHRRTDDLDIVQPGNRGKLPHENGSPQKRQIETEGLKVRARAGLRRDTLLAFGTGIQKWFALGRLRVAYQRDVSRRCAGAAASIPAIRVAPKIRTARSAQCPSR